MTDYRAYDRLSGKSRAYLPLVAVFHVVVDPCVEADIVSHRAEEAHYRIRRDDRNADCHEHGRCITAAAHKILRQPENNGEYAPEDIADRRHYFPLAYSVGDTAKEEGGYGRCRCGNANHPGDYCRIFCDFCVDKGVEPLVFHVPADLSGDSESPYEDPEFCV